MEATISHKLNLSMQGLITVLLKKKLGFCFKGQRYRLFAIAN